MARKKLSARAERRDLARAAVKLADGRDCLARLERGGAPERPIEVESSSQIEPQALTMACSRCGGAARLDEHAAQTVEGARLRVARMACPRCGASRSIWFRIAPKLPS